MLLSNLSLREPAPVSLLFQVPSLICGVFKCWDCVRFLFFTFPCIDGQLIPFCSAIFLGAKCVWGRSSCEQTRSFIKSMFSSIETILGCPEPCLLSNQPVSLNFFNKHLRGIIPFFFMNDCSKFCKLTSFFLHNHVEWLFYLHVKKPLFLVKDRHTFWACSFDL